MKKLFFCALFFLFMGLVSNAQRWAVGTNLVDYANFGTLNLEGSVAVERHWSLDMEWDYNPWTYKAGSSDQFQNRSLSSSLGTRYWPWHVYAGWWFRSSIQYQIYNRGGLLQESAEEAEAYGAGIAFGYALLLGERVNVDFGFGLWGGMKEYTIYRCTNCGRITEQGTKWFMLPDDISLAFYFIF